MRSLLFILALTLLLSYTTEGYSEEKKPDKKADAVFKALDKDGDGRISREEWEAADKDKNNKITKKEWQRFHYKSDGTVDGWKVIQWYDLNNDGFMDRAEFMENFRNRRR